MAELIVNERWNGRIKKSEVSKGQKRKSPGLMVVFKKMEEFIPEDIEECEVIEVPCNIDVEDLMDKMFKKYAENKLKNVLPMLGLVEPERKISIMMDIMTKFKKLRNLIKYLEKNGNPQKTMTPKIYPLLKEAII